VQRLYRVGTSGDWISYTDQPIKVNQGETIYAKGIDQYGNQTRTISSHTVNITDAVGEFAFDGNAATYSENATKGIINVDSSLQGKKVAINITYLAKEFGNASIKFLNASGSMISEIKTSVRRNTSYNNTTTIPNGTTQIYIDGYDRITSMQIKEIAVIN
ncbi:MAG TPA: hypothetical protein GX708_00635, partial [Gallicola sp.]|nr:hypothetical protein [Gallicola sp.]